MSDPTASARQCQLCVAGGHQVAGSETALIRHLPSARSGSSAAKSLRTDDGRDSGSAEHERLEHALEPCTGAGIVHRVEPLVGRLARRPERERWYTAIGGAARHLCRHRKDGKRGSDEQKTCPDESAEQPDAAAARIGRRLIHDAQDSRMGPGGLAPVGQSSFTGTSRPGAHVRVDVPARRARRGSSIGYAVARLTRLLSRGFSR